ncbi:YihY/virulence factor BrkB family protein [uncultured Erythrobacter sp.]|uniref:YihY/virulence factor BrkB family protein n=1 Tax=uncultured Erythrobacter sp. TaxID=263913 RepID=UPI0026187037|nr:YihY/virulence factor BrkB family protein [uncultured Erythrobacter sp.]
MVKGTNPHTAYHGVAIRSLSPEARRLRALDQPAYFFRNHEDAPPQPGLFGFAAHYLGPGTRIFEVVRRTIVGTYHDGFIHAGNLAYLAMLAFFPFFILGAALFELLGGRDRALELVTTVLIAMPPTVSRALGPVAEEIIYARDGWLLWFGAGVALWTVSSLIETIRDILRRAYGTQPIHAFWKYRLFSAGLILGAVVLLMVSLFAQVALGTAQVVILSAFPQLSGVLDTLRLSQIVPALGLVGSLYLLFYTLTPEEYRVKAYPKWPGALFTALWWLSVTSAMPVILQRFFTYNLTYGSMAGIIIALFFFWLVGLGLVIGAELNAALAEPEKLARTRDLNEETDT